MTSPGGSSAPKTASWRSSPTQAETRLPSRTEQAMEQYLERLEAGECPDRASFLSAYPDIAEELAGQLEALEFLHVTAPQLADAQDATGQELSGQATLGDFRLIKPIGRGGMGIVYEAEQLSLGRRVAVKILPFASMLDPRQLKRFQNEARAAATLEHPNIVPIYFVGQERGVHFYAMQLIEGQSLAEVLRDMRASPEGQAPSHELASAIPADASQPDDASCPTIGGVAAATAAGAEPPVAGKPLAQGILSHPGSLQTSASRREFYRTVAVLGAQAAEALQHAHDQGIIHRDIKPGNLMVDWAGKLWITDFGLARLETHESLTAAGDVLGTVAYMSPEQLSAGETSDSRSDIYSLGATLYELLTRARPFFRRSELNKVSTALPSEVPPPSRFDRNIPLDLQTIVLKAMSNDPADRYRTARSMAEDLRSFTVGAAIRARPPSRLELAMRWGQRHPRLFASLGLACILLVVVLGLSTGLVWRASLKTEAALSSVREHSEQLEAMLYLSDMERAYQAWDARKLDDVRQILKQQIPQDPSALDLRGIEWGLLDYVAAEPPSRLIGQHAGSANQLAVFPDGKRVASVGDDRLLRLWDSASGAPLATISMGDSSAEVLCAVAISPNGKIVATGSDVVQLWDAETHALIRKLTSFDYNVQSIAFSPDGRRVAVGSRYDRVRLLDLQGQLLREIEDESRHESLAFTPDGSELLIPSRQDYPWGKFDLVRLWQADLSTMRLQFPVEGAEVMRSYTLASVSPDGSFFVLCSRYSNEGPQVFDARSGELLLTLPDKRGEVNALDISPDGNVLAAGFNDGTIEYWQLERWGAGRFLTPDSTFTVSAHAGRVNSIKFADSSRLVSCGADGQVKVWQLQSGSPKHLGHPASYAVAVSPVNGEIASANVEGIRLLKLAQEKPESQLGLPSVLDSCIAFSSDGSLIATTDEEKRVMIHRRANLEISQELLLSRRPSSLSFSPTSAELAVITGSGVLTIWNMKTMSPLAELELNPTATGPHSVCLYTADGSSILAAGTLGKVVVVDATTFTVLRSIAVASNTNDMAFSPDGKILATAHDDGAIRIWNWPSGELRTTLIGHKQSVQRVAFSPTGRTLASTARDKTTRLWAPKLGRAYGILHRHATVPTDLAFAPDGTFLAVTRAREQSALGGVLIFPATDRVSGASQAGQK